MTQKTLFRAKVIAKALEGANSQTIPAEHLAIIEDWQKKTEFGGSETNLDGAFITGFLCPLLGYEESNRTGRWTIQKNTAIAGGGNVDAAIGHFNEDKTKPDEIVAPFELKGPRTKNLDAIMAGRNKTPVQQAWEYAMDARGAQWVLVSNMLEIRLYAVGYGRQAYEAFKLSELHKPTEYAKLILLLSKNGLLEGATAALLKQSEQADKDITNRLYKDYKTLRNNLIHGLKANNATLQIEEAIQYAQTILDRVLFIAFAEDTGLLPQNSLAEAYEFEDDYATMTVWERFTTLFGWVDKGMPKRKIPPYNGGLFRANKAIDDLNVPDDLCEGFKKLGEYDFASEISVNILGHIFEQSISDLEEIKASLEDADYDEKQGKRKKDGVFYTPDYITRYIVEQAIGGWLEERRQELGFYNLPELDPKKDFPQLKTLKKKNTTAKAILTPKAKKHLAYWIAYKNILAEIKVIDPACGSGAFLVQTFDYLLEEGQRANTEIERLQGGTIDLFERLDTAILKNNLYGVDLNPESIEITKLSLWLKTASQQEKLTYLDDNIKCGNSVIADAAYAGNAAFNWQESFADIFANGGFDVVVGNPPYVRMEHLKPVKPYLEKYYKTATDRADLYVYFFEKGLELLKPNGLLGYISNRTFFKTGSGNKLRHLLSETISIERIVDFNDKQIFEGATTYPAIIILKNQTPDKNHNLSFTVVTGEQVDFATLEETAPTMPQSNLTEESWQLESGAIASVRQKITTGHKTLKEVYGSPLYGIKTGLNEAFVIDQTTRDRLVQQDPNSADLIKPFLEGKDFKPWRVEPRDLYLIYIPKNEINIDDYPSIREHLLPFKEKLESRVTKQEWFELQQAQLAYKPHFESDKIIYGHFSPRALFSYESQGFFSNDKSYIIPNADFYLLALLHSNIGWFLITGISPPVRGGFYECRSQYIETLPIPQATDQQKQELGDLAKQCQQAAEARYTCQQDVLRRILDLAIAGAEVKLNKKLQNWWTLDFQTFRTEAKKLFKQDIPLADRSDWENFLKTHQQKITDLTNQITQLEQKINQKVYHLFNLTPEEISVVEGN